MKIRQYFHIYLLVTLLAPAAVLGPNAEFLELRPYKNGSRGGVSVRAGRRVMAGSICVDGCVQLGRVGRA